MSRLARILLWGFAIVSTLFGAVFGYGLWRYRADLEQTIAQGQRYELSSIERVPLAKAKEPQVIFVFKTPQGTERQIDGYAVSRALYDKIEEHPKAPMHVRIWGEPVSAMPVLEEDADWVLWRAGRLLWGPLMMIIFGLVSGVGALRASRRARKVS